MKPLKVLFVEDELHKKSRVIETITSHPELFDQPQLATTVNDALKKLSTERFDLLLADLILPRQLLGEPSEANGVDLLESVAQLDDHCGAAFTLSLSRASELTEGTQRYFAGRPWGLLQYADSTTSCLDDMVSIAQYMQKDLSGQAARNPEVDVLIVTALREPEFLAVEQALASLGPKLPLDARQYFRLAQLPLSPTRTISVAAAHCERMGPVHAAVATSKLCFALRPKLVVMAGICAGFPRKAVLGDIAAAETAWLWQDGKFAVVEGTSGFQSSPHQVHITPEVKNCVTEMKHDEVLWKSFEGRAREIGATVPKLVIGPAATSAAVLADRRVRDSIATTQHRAVVAIDMETYSVYVAAESSPHVEHFVSLKSVCDGGDEEKGDQYQQYASTVSAEAALSFIRRFFTSPNG